MKTIRPVWFTRSVAESCPIEHTDSMKEKNGRGPDAYGIYHVHDDGTQEHEADYPTLAEATNLLNSKDQQSVCSHGVRAPHECKECAESVSSADAAAWLDATKRAAEILKQGKETLAKANLCQLCGEPMPHGEEMFNYHGYSGPCPEHRAADEASEVPS
jgi:hypothetical protein